MLFLRVVRHFLLSCCNSRGSFFYAHILSGIDFFFAKKNSKCRRDEKQVIFRESIWNTHFSYKMGRLP